VVEEVNEPLATAISHGSLLEIMAYRQNTTITLIVSILIDKDGLQKYTCANI
jgi:hypothetical protein